MALDDYFRREDPPLARLPDLEGWPADVEETIRAVSEVFNLRPPSVKVQKAFWVKAGRELADACLPHRPHDVLVELQRDLTEKLHRGKGWDVCGPQSLVNEARRVAGEMGTRQLAPSDSEEEQDNRIECPRCHVMVNPGALEMRCEGAHYVRGSELDPRRPAKPPTKGRAL